jgi:hypothetical protein
MITVNQKYEKNKRLLFFFIIISKTSENIRKYPKISENIGLMFYTSNNFQYFIQTWSIDNCFSTTLPKVYSMMKVASGTVNPKNGEGSFTLDDNVFQATTGTSSIGGGAGSVSFVTGRDSILLQTLLTRTGPILPSSYSDSKGILYIIAPTPPLWLQSILQAINPFSLGLEKKEPVTSSYYQPADSTLQLCTPSLLPNIQLILVYAGSTPGSYVRYLLKAHNEDKVSIIQKQQQLKPVQLVANTPTLSSVQSVSKADSSVSNVTAVATPITTMPSVKKNPPQKNQKDVVVSSSLSSTPRL